MPANPKYHLTSNNGISVSFEHSGENISHFVCGVGSTKETADYVMWRTFKGTNTPVHLLPYLTQVKQSFFINILAVHQNGAESSILSVGPLNMPIIQKEKKSETSHESTRNIAPSQEIFFNKSSDNASETLPAHTNLQAVFKSIYGAYLHFDYPDTSIPHHFFAFGTTPGASDLSGGFHSTFAYEKNTISWSLRNLGLQTGDVFYITLYTEKTIDGVRHFSPRTSSNPLTFNWVRNVGADNNPIHFEFVDFSYAYVEDSANPGKQKLQRIETSGWTTEEKQVLNTFIPKMKLIIRNIFGAPAFPSRIKLVKDASRNSTNIYFPHNDEIHMGGISDFRLLTHEMIHAFRGKTILAVDKNWNYHPTLSGFEESMAQAAAYICMNEYIKRYPNDQVNGQTISESWHVWSSYRSWEYDYLNVPAIGTEAFDSAGALMFGIRYELGAAAIQKLYIETPNFFKLFNKKYYHRLSNLPNLSVDRKLIVDLIKQAVTEIEGCAADHWIDRQHIFDCESTVGKKIWLHSLSYPHHQCYVNTNYVYFYETFDAENSGKDWSYSYTDANGQPAFGYHKLNGSHGRYNIYNSKGQYLKGNSFQLLPTENPPAVYEYGTTVIHIVNNKQEAIRANINNINANQANSFIEELATFGLYRINIRMTNPEGGETVQSFYRISGTEMTNPNAKLVGGIINANGGNMYFKHEHDTFYLTVPIQNGAFLIENVAWLSQPISNSRFKNINSGKVEIIYEDRLGKKYQIYRNMPPIQNTYNVGNMQSYAIQTWLLDVKDMKAINRFLDIPILTSRQLV